MAKEEYRKIMARKFAVGACMGLVLLANLYGPKESYTERTYLPSETYLNSARAEDTSNLSSIVTNVDLEN